MVYTVQELISGAYYKSGIVANEFQTVSGSQQARALKELNKALSLKTVQKYFIPYYTEFSFPGVVGQEEYTIANLVNVSTLTFVLNNTRFTVYPRSRDKYFGSTRANNVQTLPYWYHFERQFGGGNIYLYFLPNEAYQFTLWGKFRLASVAFNDDLELTHELFYIDYLENVLAKRLCNEFNFAVPVGVTDSIKEMESAFKDQMSPLDLTCNKTSTLTKRDGIDAYVEGNLAEGWRPGY